MRLFIAILLLIPFIILVLTNNYKNKCRYVCMFFEIIIVIGATIVVLNRLAINLDYQSVLNGKLSYIDINKLSICYLIILVFSTILGFVVSDKQIKIVKHKKLAVIILLIIGFISSIFAMNFSYEGNKNVKITEICGSVETDYVNYEDGLESNVSYVKLYNDSNYTCLFDELFLSTDLDNLFLDSYNSVQIDPFTEITLFVRKDKLDLKNNKVSSLYLSSNQYNNYITKVEYPSLKDNEYYKLDLKTGLGKIERHDETFKNKLVEKPIFSISGGFYNNELDVQISASDGYEVYYTIDSSDPTTESIKYNGKPIHVYDRTREKNIYRNVRNVTVDYLTNYSEPENVDKCFVLRAIACDSLGNCSEIETQTYFVNLDKYKNKKVISLVSDPDKLFGENGIYVTGKEYDDWYKNNIEYVEKYPKEDIYELNEVFLINFLKRGIGSEIEGNMEYFSFNNCCINQLVGVRIQGHATRLYPSKRFSIYSREKYTGSNIFNGKIINDNNVHSIVLRESKNNYIVNKALGDRDLAHLNCEEVVVFLDGEYWYTTYVFEKFSKTKFNKDYKLLKENIEFQQGTNDEIRYFVENEDMKQEENYLALNSFVDVQSFIDFQVTTIYFSNVDYREWHNVLTWKSINKENNNPYGDCRWRWGVYDSDIPFVKDNNSFASLKEYNHIHNALLNSDIYRMNFTRTFMDFVNSYFSIEKMKYILEDAGFDLSYSDNFFVERSKYITKYLEEEMGLKGTQEEVKLSSNKKEAGIITLNTINPDLQNDWLGKYYTDYPIELTVKENEGYKFKYWEINGEYYSDKLSINVNIPVGGVEIVAIYE